MLLLCTALSLDGSPFGDGSLRSMAVEAVVARTGAPPRTVPPFSWQSATSRSSPEAFAGELLGSEAGAELLVGSPEGNGGPPEGNGSIAELAEALDAFSGWLDQLPRLDEEALLVTGFAAAQDLAFLVRAFRSVGRMPPFSMSPLDLRSLALGVLGLPWDETAPMQLASHLGVRLRPWDGGTEGGTEAQLGATVLMLLLEQLRRRAASAMVRR